ncbi:DNA-3-methyladenine glycosylase [Williamsia limnetica]|uniref:Putative 3-methyladenine DNA glycosylase n=1 Tax=Williamsia limnetica TaxID=882452 RepID=A0A318RGQ3_WILLI|nr:DNA-3-methyladenine glycosylase [Williamsia limnetica]PYE16052.1 DNA-3-methyladenine glycosylase [Williamsia limnetica]
MADLVPFDVTRLASATPLQAARRLLGSLLEVDAPDGTARMRIVEVEAYGGSPGSPFPDPASHGYRGPTDRNRVMYGSAGHLYVYRSYGIHWCGNISYGPVGQCGGVLMRAGEIVAGHDLVSIRRPTARTESQFACGPGNVGSAMGITRELNGSDVSSPDSPVRLYRGPRIPASAVQTGPRVGVSSAQDQPWRLWDGRSSAVSKYRRAEPLGALRLSGSRTDGGRSGS